MPMMMTAAGTVPAARVFVMGAGVAGLQAVATARRLGAVVTATDVRPAAKEQVASLGAKFIAVEDEEFKAAETAAGYAKEMSKDYQAKQAALVDGAHRQAGHRHHHGARFQDARRRNSSRSEMVASMADGSVIVDLAVERGGNVEGAVPGEVAQGRTASRSSGISTWPAASRPRPRRSSARNIYAFVEPMIDKATKSLFAEARRRNRGGAEWLLTADGEVVDPAFSA